MTDELASQLIAFAAMHGNEAHRAGNWVVVESVEWDGATNTSHLVLDKVTTLAGLRAVLGY